MFPFIKRLLHFELSIVKAVKRSKSCVSDDSHSSVHAMPKVAPSLKYRSKRREVRVVYIRSVRRRQCV